MIKTFIFLILMLVNLVFSSDLMPRDNFMPGWQKTDSLRVYDQNNLYGHIDGGAELFFELGFNRLELQKYGTNRQEIVVEIYKMTNPYAALGIYLLKKGREVPIEGLTARNTGNRFQILMVKGLYYIQIFNFAGDSDLNPVMLELAQIMQNHIYIENTDINPLANIPDQNRVAGTERIFCGPYSLQSIFTFGTGDLFKLRGKIYGLAADYKNEENNSYTLLTVSYRDTNQAQDAFISVKNNLDPYLIVLNSTSDLVVFSDYKNQFGLIERKNEVLEIKVNLNKIPDSGKVK